MKFRNMTRKKCIASVKKFWKKANKNEYVNSSLLGKTRKLKHLTRKNMKKLIQRHVKDVCKK